MWSFLAGILGLVCAGLQFWSVSKLDPGNHKSSQKRIILSYFLRILFIGLFFWQMVQRGLHIIILSLIIFLAVYFGSVFYIAFRKPHWLKTKD